MIDSSTLYADDRLVLARTDAGADGFEWDSAYAEQFWLPFIGPTSWALLRQLNRLAPPLPGQPPAGISRERLADHLGVYVSKLGYTLERCIKYNMLDKQGEIYGIGHGIRVLNRHKVAKLNESLQNMHAQYLDDPARRLVA